MQRFRVSLFRLRPSFLRTNPHCSETTKPYESLTGPRGVSELVRRLSSQPDGPFYKEKNGSLKSSLEASRRFFGRLRGFGPLALGLAVSGCIGTTAATFADSGKTPLPPLIEEQEKDKNVEEEKDEIVEENEDDGTQGRKKKIVVLGTGWGGMSFLKNLDTSVYDVVVISPRNYFLFTPLLPGVTSGSVEARSISEPIRRIIYRSKKQAQFLEAECVSMDPTNKTVRCRDVTAVARKGLKDFDVSYDYLVVSVGAEVNTFNTPGVREHCHFLKEVEDAEKIRESVVDLFEAATLPGISMEEKKRLLHFLVIGGGPTGVEYAAELHDLVKDDLSKIYPDVNKLWSITLIQSGDHILNMFDQRISDFASKKFQRDGIDVRTGARVIDVTENDIEFRDKQTGDKKRCDYGMIVWSTGIGTRPVISDLMEKAGQGGRRALATDEWLRVKGCHDVWALGDCASIEHRPMRDDISLLFKMADADGDGMLSVNEMTNVLDKVKERYPQISFYLKRQTFRDLLKDAHPEADPRAQKSAQKAEVRISIGEFETALGKVDAQMKSYPATAQVAAQQGDYLARCFNKLQDDKAGPEGPIRVRGTGKHRFRPFTYRHLGQFAPLGSGQAGVELPGDWVNLGQSSMWLWYSVYASKQVSWRTRFLVVFDWIKRAVFGRDSSRM